MSHCKRDLHTASWPCCSLEDFINWLDTPTRGGLFYLRAVTVACWSTSFVWWGDKNEGERGPRTRNPTSKCHPPYLTGDFMTDLSLLRDHHAPLEVVVFLLLNNESLLRSVCTYETKIDPSCVVHACARSKIRQRLSDVHSHNPRTPRCIFILIREP